MIKRLMKNWTSEWLRIERECLTRAKETEVSASNISIVVYCIAKLCS